MTQGLYVAACCDHTEGSQDIVGLMQNRIILQPALDLFENPQGSSRLVDTLGSFGFYVQEGSQKLFRA